MCGAHSGIEKYILKALQKIQSKYSIFPCVQAYAFEAGCKVGNGSRRPTLHFASFSTQ